MAQSPGGSPGAGLFIADRPPPLAIGEGALRGAGRRAGRSPSEVSACSWADEADGITLSPHKWGGEAEQEWDGTGDLGRAGKGRS